MKKLALVLFIALLCAVRCAPSLPTSDTDTIAPVDPIEPKPTDCEIITHTRVVREGIKCPYTDEFTNGLISVSPPKIECFKLSVNCE